MFGVDSTEFIIVAVLALIFIGPKDLPKVMRTVGYWIGRIRGTARHFTAGIENMIREAELEEMDRKWREENERIMTLHPPGAQYPDPPPAPSPAAAPVNPPAPADPGLGLPDDMPPLAHPRAGEGDDGDAALPREQRPLP